MSELYGSAFKAAFGDAPTPIWERAIAELTDDECRTGLNTLSHQAREYPANLTQFLAACKPRPAGVRYLGVPIDSTDPRLALPPPSKQASRERIDGWLAKIRATLRGKAQDAADRGA